MSALIETIMTTRLIGIIRLKRYHHPVEIARALVEGGIKALEFTLSGEGALESITAARQALERDIHVGAGTVLSPEDVAKACDAGAEFVVTPSFDPQVVVACERADLPIVCGAFTPTEMMNALLAGADLIKLFPARLGGPQYVRDLLAPYPNLRLVPTGGVSADNAADYLKAGAVAVAIGGKLVSQEDVDDERYFEITRRATACVQAVSN